MFGIIFQELVDYLAALYIALYGLLRVIITSNRDEQIHELRVQNRINSKKNHELAFFCFTFFIGRMQDLFFSFWVANVIGIIHPN